MENKNEDKLSDSIDSLIRELENSTDPQDNELSKKAKKMHSHQKEFNKSISKLQETLDYLRICIKYQVFDLEATRRENAYLRKLLKGEFDDEELIG